METHESNPLVSSIQWLEEQHQQGKATTFKLQQQIDQAQAGLWAQGDRVHQLEQSITSVAAQGTHIAKLEDELRHVRDIIDRLQEAQNAEGDRWAALERARLAEQERDRQEMAQIFQKLESAERENLYLRNRLGSMDEGIHRLQEELAQVSGRVDEQARRGDVAQGRIQHLQEQLKRKDEEVGRLDDDLDALRKQDELQLGRIQMLGEQVRRVEDLGSLRDLETRLTSDLGEKLDLQRVERQRLERTVTEISLHQEQQGSRVEELSQVVTQVDAKVSGQSDYVNQLREQVWSLRDDMAAQFTEAFRMEEQQKRRLMADLEQQLLEIKNRSARIVQRPNA